MVCLDVPFSPAGSDVRLWGEVAHLTWAWWRRTTVWQLPPAARALVVGVVAIAAATVALAWADTSFRSDDLSTTLAFAAAAIAGAEVSMRFAWPRTRRDRISRDLLSVWILPIALLLPPVYVLTVVLLTRVYVHVRIARVQTMKSVYTAAAISLSYAAASITVRVALGRGLASTLDAADLEAGARAAAAVALAVLAWWIVNSLLVCGVVALTAGADALRTFFRDREGIVVDAVAACIGILAALLWSTKPVTVALLIPPVLLLQHQLFSGLRKAVRTDLLTDVANPQFWRDIASREVERAWASGANLAIMMIDIDHFKEVNDRHGHLAGDEVLASVARAIAQALRPRDLVGRLGGEEFGAILTGLSLPEAEGAAERLREQVASVRVRSDHGEWINVTVSVGIAELSVTGGNLHQLLDAADVALYAAKAAGRDRVRVAGPRSGRVIDLTAAEARPSSSLASAALDARNPASGGISALGGDVPAR